MLMGLVDALGHDRVVIAGHDWGGLLVWIMARQYPERVAGVIGVNTPDLPRPPMPPVQLLRQISSTRRSTSSSSRIAAWPSGCSARGAAARRFRRDDVRRGRRRSPPRFRPRCSTCTRRVPPVGALTPPIEYYRNMDRNWELTAPIADRTVEVPCLMISAAGDPVLTPAMTTAWRSASRISSGSIIENCGHWTQQERPDETTAAMLAYLRRLPQLVLAAAPFRKICWGRFNRTQRAAIAPSTG